MTQIKTSFALPFPLQASATPFQNIPTRKRPLQSRDVRGWSRNQHQSEFWSPALWVTRKEKYKQSATSTSKSWSQTGSQRCCSREGLCANSTHLTEAKAKKEISQMNPQIAMKACVNRPPFRPPTPPARCLCDKYKLISQEWIISSLVHLHFKQPQRVPWARSERMIINSALLRRHKVLGRREGGAKCAF